MLDFLMIATRYKRDTLEIYPKFVIKQPSKDLMIRGRDFYAVWVEERKMWSTDEQDALRLIDKELDDYAERAFPDSNPRILHMWDAESGMIDAWHKYCQKQMRDSFHMLDEKLIFSNTETKRKDYSSKRLNYPLEVGACTAYEKLMSTLYSEEERRKIEWAIGSIVTGDSKKIQKFMVLYGAAGTGKSTVLNIIQQLFEGYYSVFDAKALGSSSSAFALEAFNTNPLVAIQHDGDLSKIEDNTRLNSLVSHELMTVNEKFKSTYTSRFKCFLFMGTNKPVKITDGKSGLLRRLIDVTPSGNKLEPKEYKAIMKQISFELGAIANHCKEVYLSDPGYYDDYVPADMLGATNDFYNFVIDSYHIFLREDGTTSKAAWEMYKNYCDEAKVPYPLPLRAFKEELKNYFRDFNERVTFEDGSRVRSYYSGFRTEKFETKKKKKTEHKHNLIEFEEVESIFDKECADCFAQYASSKETPLSKWEKVTSKLSEIDTSKLHYVKVPENHIVIDFDIKDKNGNKSFEKNLEEASKWPATYAELSKSGAGVHLHYIYTGDVTKLSRVYDENVEIKVFTGKSSLRRKLTKCNNLPIASISSGLPLKGEDKMINFEGLKNEKMLRAMIKRNLNKEYHAATKPSVDYIYALLEDAYNSGMCYDVSDMHNSVLAFAAGSTNQSDYCIKLVNRMKFKSEDISAAVSNEEAAIVFYDVEVFPNLFLVNWKFQGKGKPVVRMINPKPKDIEELLSFRLIGFNCRRYDNHILYARLMGLDNQGLYELSKKIINSPKGENNKYLYGEAYNISYTDVYDFAATKQSLKKWEIELGIHHQELGLPWDQPVPEERWDEVAEYCDNDVIATEAVFDHLAGDFRARQILAELAGGTVNDTTNTLSTKFIFGNNRTPQSSFNYRNLAEPVGPERYEEIRVAYGRDDFRIFDDKGQPTYQTYIPGTKLPKGYSILPFFPGYKYEFGKSTYRGIDVGEGGCVIAEPGMYVLLALLDVQSMHPASIIAEVLFGPEFTRRFQEIRDGRVAIKHKDFEKAKSMLNGVLAKYLDDPTLAADLSYALKIVINSIYGLTAARFTNPFRDKRNIDNIVAKRGALFMVNLMNEVQARGFTVAHIKTDSIKIPNATEDIIKFVMDYGKEFGYIFEHEATYDRMCLVNNAVYIAKYLDGDWTATGTQFQVPYVFKTLFSKEPIEFDDLCETKEVKTAMYLENDSGDLQFIGRVGNFCPLKSGNRLVKEAKDKEGNVKLDSVTGAKDYLWAESEFVRTNGLEKDIDMSYFNNLVDNAVDAISKYGDFEWFVSGDPLPDIETPPWKTECGRDSCLGCQHLNTDRFDIDCLLGYNVGDLKAMNDIYTK